MRDYFEEMNIDYNELKRYEDIETYYDEVQDYTKLIKELQCDRVEALKQIVNKNKEIERLNNKEEQLIRRLEDLIIVGEQVENEWAVDICKMIIKELKGSDKE